MPLRHLNCKGTNVSDLSPLKETTVKDLHCDFNPKRDTEILLAIPTLQTINGTPTKMLLKKDAAKKP